MRPVRTDASNLKLIGGPVGSGIGDMHVERDPQSGWIRSVWQPTPEEREALAAGANIALFILRAIPPVVIEVTDEAERREDAVAARLLAEVGR